MTSRRTLPDREDESLLQEAEVALRIHFALVLSRDPRISEIVELLTDPAIRHHVQTLLDLTPSR